MVLRCFSGFQQAILLSLFDPIVASQQAGAFQNRLKFFVEFHQCTCNSQPDRFRLTGMPTAVNPNEKIEFTFCLSQVQGLLYGMPVAFQAEEIIKSQRLLVDIKSYVSLSRPQIYAGDGCFPFSCTVILN